MDQNLSPAGLFASVRREILAARSRDLPWEYRVEWAHASPTPYPDYTTGRAQTEVCAAHSARALLSNMTESADPRAVAAWIKGPDDVDFRPVDHDSR